MHAWHKWWVRAAGALILAMTAVAPASQTAAGDGAVVRTTGGFVRGVVGPTFRSFQGIPFAAPPVGALRWAPPGPAAPWKGVRDATAFASPCAQARGVFAAPTVAGTTSEDCLYLNVYTPNPIRHDLPVLFWIHGGGFVNGSASQYDPRVLTVKANAVVVTINYRLGVFGFLAMPVLSAQAPDQASGNYGLEDQQAAMRWVRRNIELFGGDAHQVAIFGESAGGLSVCDQLASPTAEDLFQRAITESGPCAATQPTLSAAEKAGTAFAATPSLGCSTLSGAALVACLRGLSPAAVLAVGGQFGPNVGGSVLPRQVPTAIGSGQFNRVPVIEGTNHDEFRLFVALGFDLVGHPITPALYPALIAGTFGAINAARVLAQYPLSSYANGSIAYATVVTDARFSCPALAADALLATRVPTYAYEFTDEDAPQFLTPPDPVMPQLGAFHAAELAFLFPPLNQPAGFFNPAEKALSGQMMGYWGTFADEATPNHSGAPFWPRFRAGAEDGLIQSLDPAGIHPETTFAADHKCAFWASLV